MALVTISEPGWHYFNNFPKRDGVQGKSPGWFYLFEGDSVILNEVDGYLYLVNPADPDNSTANDTYIVYFNAHCKLYLKNITASGGDNTLGTYADWLENGNISNDDIYTYKLPAKMNHYEFNETTITSKEMLVGSFLANGVYKIIWQKARFQFGDEGIWYRINSNGVLYKDPNQSEDAVRFPTNTECTKTSVTNKTLTASGKSKSSTLNYVNKNATAEAVVEFTGKLNALSKNTPQTITRINKRALSESVVKETPIFNITLDEDSLPRLPEGYYSADATVKTTPEVEGVAAVAYEHYDYKTDSQPLEKESYIFQWVFEANTNVPEDDLHIAVSAVNLDTGKPVKVLHWDPFWNTDEKFTEQTEPPEDYTEEDQYVDVLYIPYSAVGEVDGWGYAVTNIALTFTLQETQWFKGASVTINTKILKARYFTDDRVDPRLQN